ncbi:MAG: DUF899 domain-containing protein [Anaerolineae bacterium]|nr:DUF899 domain-containing protein [Phycisphaerae bacterium]
MNIHQIVSREQWIETRRELLAKEKQLTRQRDELARQRRDLPWVRVEADYVFDAPHGKVTLAELFGEKSQLIVYHFMYGPEWKEGCPSCSFVTDHLDGAVPHLSARDVSLVLISRAPLTKIQAFQKRMGWRIPWVSSNGSDFNYDYHVSFTPAQKASGKVDYNYTMQKFPSDEAPGASVFYKEPATGEIFHTYSVYARGLDQLVGTYTLLDLVPKGRDEDKLGFSMEWVRHHDRYNGGEFADPDKPYWPRFAPAEKSGAKSFCGCAAAEATA